MIVAEGRAKGFAKLFFLGGGNFEAEFLFQRGFGLGPDHVLELGAENFADGPVKFHRLGHAHAMHLDAHNEQAGAGEKVNDVAGAAGRRNENYPA